MHRNLGISTTTLFDDMPLVAGLDAGLQRQENYVHMNMEDKSMRFTSARKRLAGLAGKVSKSKYRKRRAKRPGENVYTTL